MKTEFTNIELHRMTTFQEYAASLEETMDYKESPYGLLADVKEEINRDIKDYLAREYYEGVAGLMDLLANIEEVHAHLWIAAYGCDPEDHYAVYEVDQIEAEMINKLNSGYEPTANQ